MNETVGVTFGAFVFACVALFPLVDAVVSAHGTIRISESSQGVQGNGHSLHPSLSADGRFVAFESQADNLVPGDTNVECLKDDPRFPPRNCTDVFVRDVITGRTTRASVASDGTQANGMSYAPMVSGNGRFVAFKSQASNLVPDDTNGIYDVFVHDRDTGETTRVSVDSNGRQIGPHSGADCFSRCSDPSITPDGRFVVVGSWSPELVPGDTNDQADVFVHDRFTRTTERVSVASDGAEGNDGSYLGSYGPYQSISDDGRLVVFRSVANNLVPDDTNTCTVLPPFPQGKSCVDVFVHDRVTHTTRRVSVASDGTQGNAESVGFSISGDGRFVFFDSKANNLVSGDTNNFLDVFVHDLEKHETLRVSVGPNREEGNGESGGPSISRDGRYVAFQSRATNLAPEKTNDEWQVLVRDRATGRTVLGSVSSNGTPADTKESPPGGVISSDGNYLALVSVADNLVEGDTNNAYDVFLHAMGPEAIAASPAAKDQMPGFLLPLAVGALVAAAFLERRVFPRVKE